MRKTVRNVILVFLTSLLMLSFTACEGLEIKDDSKIRASVTALLDATVEGNADTAYGMVYSGIDRTEFDAVFVQIHDMIADAEEYALTPIQYHITVNNGVKYTQAGYLMSSENVSFVVTVVEVEGYEGFTSFNITPEAQTSLHYTGIPGKMQGANAAQWIVLGIGVLTWVFVIWMLVDCCRQKIRRKPLWIVLIILVAVVIKVTIVGENFNMGFNVGLYLQLSSLIRYGNGAMELNFVVPLGAVIYGITRKKLMVLPENEAANVETEPELSNEEEL